MNDPIEDDGVRLRMQRDFRPESLSEYEREALRAYFPQLMAELLQLVTDSETEE